MIVVENYTGPGIYMQLKRYFIIHNTRVPLLGRKRKPVLERLNFHPQRTLCFRFGNLLKNRDNATTIFAPY